MLRHNLVRGLFFAFFSLFTSSLSHTQKKKKKKKKTVFFFNTKGSLRAQAEAVLVS
jgi:hypothetical protein